MGKEECFRECVAQHLDIKTSHMEHKFYFTFYCISFSGVINYWANFPICASRKYNRYACRSDCVQIDIIWVTTKRADMTFFREAISCPRTKEISVNLRKTWACRKLYRMHGAILLLLELDDIFEWNIIIINALKEPKTILIKIAKWLRRWVYRD